MSQFNQALNSVAVRVLEDWGLMLVDPGTSNVEEFPGEKWFHTSVEFLGDEGVSGKIHVVCKDTFATTLATNVLGIEEEHAKLELQLLDAVKELANVVTGNFVTEAFDEDVIFALTTPNGDEVELEEAEKFVAQSQACLLGDEEPVCFYVETYESTGE